MQRAPSRPRFSIRSRIVLLLIGTLLFFALLQGVFLYNLFRDQEKAAARAELQTARFAANSFNEHVEQISRLAHSIGTALSMPEWSPLQIQSILDKSSAACPSVYSLAWVDAEGLVLASSLPGITGADLSETEWFRAISRGRDLFLSNIFNSGVTGEPVIGLARGIRDDKGRLLGVVLASVLPDELSKTLAFDKTAGAVVVILDRTGKTVAWPSGHKPASDELEKLAKSPPVLMGLRGDELVDTFDPGTDGKNKLIALTPVFSSGFLSCSIRAREDIRGPIIRGIIEHTVILLVFAAAMIIFAFGVSRTVAAPIEELRNRIASLANGRKNQPLIVPGPPEIVDLTESFNQMAEEIHLREVERFSHLGRLRGSMEVTVELLAETTVQGLLQKIVDASRVLTDTNFAVVGMREGDDLGVGSVSRASDIVSCPSFETFRFSRNGIYREIIDSGLPVRYTDAEMRRHPSWNEFVKDHGIVRGILGAPLKDTEGNTRGLIMALDKREGEFTREDEAVLTQLAAVASLGLQQVRACGAVGIAREQLGEANEALERRVREHAAEFAEMDARLVREINERKRAEEERGLYLARLGQSNRDFDAFAAKASHDLLEPLRKVQAFGDRLEKKCWSQIDEEGRDYIRRMQNAAGRMQTMVRSLLGYSGVGAAARPMTDTDLRKVLDQIIRDLEIRIEHKKARIELDNLPVIEADSDQMRHLFQNLISNSLKFSGDREPIIKISSHDIAPPPGKGATQPWYEILVEDNGMGFEEESAEELFGLFQRLHGRDGYEGSGIGLAICKRVVERHDGTISARGEPGKGTTFVIRLPRRQRGTGHRESTSSGAAPGADNASP
ncbi:MAG: ATP-binding protein [Syntrophobacter sp.]